VRVDLVHSTCYDLAGGGPYLSCTVSARTIAICMSMKIALSVSLD